MAVICQHCQGFPATISYVVATKEGSFSYGTTASCVVAIKEGSFNEITSYATAHRQGRFLLLRDHLLCRHCQGRLLLWHRLLCRHQGRFLLVRDCILCHGRLGEIILLCHHQGENHLLLGRCQHRQKGLLEQESSPTPR